MGRLIPHRLFAASAVISAGTVESGVVDLRRLDRNVAFAFQAVSGGGTPDIQIDAIYSDDGVTFGAYGDHGPIIASSFSAFGATPEGIQFVDFELAVAPFAKFRASGVNANPSDSLVTVTMEGNEA